LVLLKSLNDGVTIAKEIELENKFENIGASLAREAAEKTNDLAGDGTTTATILTQAIVTEGLKMLQLELIHYQLKKALKKELRQ